MLKKKLKSLLCAVLSAVTIISAVPVTASAATDYTPRKKHTQEEIAEVCNYISSVTDRYAMMPNGWFPAQYGPETKYNCFISGTAWYEKNSSILSIPLVTVKEYLQDSEGAVDESFS